MNLANDEAVSQSREKDMKKASFDQCRKNSIKACRQCYTKYSDYIATDFSTKEPLQTALKMTEMISVRTKEKNCVSGKEIGKSDMSTRKEFP